MFGIRRITYTEDGTDGAGLDRGSDQAFNDVVGLWKCGGSNGCLVENRKTLTPETSLTSPKEVEKRQSGRNVNLDTLRCKYGHVRDANVD